MKVIQIHAWQAWQPPGNLSFLVGQGNLSKGSERIKKHYGINQEPMKINEDLTWQAWQAFSKNTLALHKRSPRTG